MCVVMRKVADVVSPVSDLNITALLLVSYPIHSRKVDTCQLVNLYPLPNVSCYPKSASCYPLLPVVTCYPLLPISEKDVHHQLGNHSKFDLQSPDAVCYPKGASCYP